MSARGWVGHGYVSGNRLGRRGRLPAARADLAAVAAERHAAAVRGLPGQEFQGADGNRRVRLRLPGQRQQGTAHPAAGRPAAPAAPPARHLAAAHRLGQGRVGGARHPRLGHAGHRRQPHLVRRIPERLHPRRVPARGNGRAGGGRPHQRRGLPALAGAAQQPAAVGSLRGPGGADGIRADGAAGSAGRRAGTRVRHGAAVTILETTAYRAPLGLLCTDSVSGAAVSDGLVVTAWPAGNPGAARTPVPSTVSAVLVFGRLPGLTCAVLANDPHNPQWPAASLAFEVRVTDPLGRYLPELMLVTVTGGTLATPLLYSAPARPAPAGFAAVNGEVWSTVTSRPAAWAVVKITSDTDTYLTLTDQLGRYVAYFPYPEALPPLTGSPPS